MSGLQNQHQVVLKARKSSINEFLYTPIYQLFPQLWSIPFTLTKTSVAKDIMFDYLSSIFQKEVTAHIRQVKPDLIINTHFMYQPTLNQIRRKKKIPLLNVVTDPITFHPLIIDDEAESNLLYSSETLGTVHEMSPEGNFDVTGWWVRPQFVPIKDKAHLRSELGLDPNQTTIVLASGSDGTQGIMKIFPMLMKKDLSVQVVVACGSNKNMARASKLLASFTESQQSNVKVVTLGFTSNMHKYFAAADLIVGKAGPNTIFEAIACHVPFMAITHIEGQENGNLDLIRNENIGWVEEKAPKANILLEKLITDKRLRESKRKDIERLAAYNSASSAKVRAVVERVLKEKNE